MLHRFMTAAALMLPLTFPANAFETNDIEGVWTSVFRNNDRGVLEFSLRIVRDVGTLMLKAKRWGDLGIGSCSYAFAVDNDAIGKIILNPAASTNGNCPDQIPFKVKRTSLERLNLTFDQSVHSMMGGLAQAKLFGTLRPLRDHERRAVISNLDILGIAPTMPRPQAEERLAELGFEKVKAKQATFDGGFVSASEHWSRNPNADDIDMDHLSLTYTSIREGSDDTERLVAISRENYPQEPLLLSVFDDAITDKYGPAPKWGDRGFFREGHAVTRQDNNDCREDVHQDIQFAHAKYNRFSSSGGYGSKNFSINCGAEVSVSATPDANTGTVQSYRITVYDIDMIWEDFWTRWSTIEGAKIRAQFEVLNTTSTDKPEL